MMMMMMIKTWGAEEVQGAEKGRVDEEDRTSRKVQENNDLGGGGEGTPIVSFQRQSCKE